jgi:cytochrome c oxidase cbb3-type subunit 1
MYPYYIARTFGGLLFLIGAIVASFNIWMTVRMVPAPDHASSDVPLVTEAYGAATSPAE